jgi:pimeloyl-ACP methyl ester carboxylesterase
MTTSDEFTSLFQSAADLSIPHGSDVRYLSRQTVLRGLRFHFLEWGRPDNPPILLLHGGNQSGHSWDLVSLHLAEHYHVFALDQRGHGDSEWARDLDYSIDSRAADALAFIDDQGLGIPVVLGHSMGGAVAMTMALTRDHLARGLVLVDTGPELSPTGRQIVRDFVRNNVEFDDLDTFLDNVVRYDRFRSREHVTRTVKYNMLRRADGKFVSKVDHRDQTPDTDTVSPEPASIVAVEDFGSFDYPVLVIRGAESDVLEADAAERFAAALPDGRLVTVARAGHNVHGANTLGFLDALKPFLDALR